MDTNLRLVNPQREAERRWVHTALAKLQQESARSADTHLLKLNFPGFHGIDFYFKDEARIRPAASSIGSRARCSCTRCAMAACAKDRRWWMLPPAAPQFPRRGSRACWGCLSSR